MSNFGIYTLANDIVYDQLVALLNSIEVNVSSDIPICIIPYDERIDQVKAEVKSRPQVTLFDNYDVIKKWDKFTNEVWDAHPRARDSRLKRPGWYKGFVHRKLAAFDGEFDKFIFYDADSLAMKRVADVWQKVTEYDLVFDDWEHDKPENATDINLEMAAKKYNLPEKELSHRLHCNSFVASRRDLFSLEELQFIQNNLVHNQEIDWINYKFWWSSSALFNYMTLDPKYSIFNYTLSPRYEDRTGNCANADAFVNQNNILYNQDGMKPIYRIHYMSYGASEFARLSRGEDVDICYRNEFLYYRFMHQPEQKPRVLTKPSLPTVTNRFIQKTVKKIQRTFA
ncbi:Npun_R2821/Npun_R2822 family protein [Calothrix sp. 336/3]|uniref:Npun_R2821/Npun_R2822 family protein n=1 Tax=Calothrix sp. 336/3 TaxID=1337936 RepID=UPI0004E316DB|nr:Npun_R2821/Npun_R2822 family protein [Calothrix sp. 336/3]AKG22984.1 methionine synthase [Calothrix sp. 336/3]